MLKRSDIFYIFFLLDYFLDVFLGETERFLASLCRSTRNANFPYLLALILLLMKIYALSIPQGQQRWHQDGQRLLGGGHQQLAQLQPDLRRRQWSPFKRWRTHPHLQDAETAHHTAGTCHLDSFRIRKIQSMQLYTWMSEVRRKLIFLSQTCLLFILSQCCYRPNMISSEIE